MRAGALQIKGWLNWPSPKSESLKFDVHLLYYTVFVFLLVSLCDCKVHAQTVENESFINDLKYFDNVAISGLFSDLQRQFPHLARAYSIGKTLENREMNVLALSAPGDVLVGDLLKPMVKVVANIHGDEALGRQMILYMAQYLVLNYATVPEIQELLNTTEIHFLPSCNPDGFAAAKVS